MNGRLRTLLGISALCLGFAAGSAQAAESRTSNFLFACDGTNKHLTITVTGLGASTTRFIQSASIVLFQNNGGLQYILLAADGNPNKILLNMGLGQTNAQQVYISSLFATTTNAAGEATFTIDGACTPGGANQIQGNVLITYFS